MAVETLILRPTYACFTTGVTFSPNIDDDLAYILVSEDTPDDDATYISTTNITDPMSFGFTLPNEYVNKVPTSINICCYAKNGGDGEGSILLQFCILDNDSKTWTGDGHDDSLTSSYQMFYEFVPTENIAAFYSAMQLSQEENQYGVVRVSASPNSSNSKNETTFECRVTQVYLELTYDDSEDTGSETLYIKQNGTWVAITGDIYQKQNGTWVLADSSVFEAGFRYTLNDMTMS